mgnify:CR=1 FL=1
MRICSHYLKRKYSIGSNVPEIRLRGKWLHNAGFEIGDYVLITITEKGLLISTDNKNEDITLLLHQKKTN